MSRVSRKNWKKYESQKSQRSNCSCDWHSNNRMHSTKKRLEAAKVTQ